MTAADALKDDARRNRKPRERLATAKCSPAMSRPQAIVRPPATVLRQTRIMFSADHHNRRGVIMQAVGNKETCGQISSTANDRADDECPGNEDGYA